MLISERAIRRIVNEEIGGLGDSRRPMNPRPEAILEGHEIRALRLAAARMRLLREADESPSGGESSSGGELADKAWEFLSSPLGKKVVVAILKVIKFFTGKFAEVHDLVMGGASSNVMRAIKWVSKKFGYEVPVEGLKEFMMSMAKTINPGDWASTGIDALISWVQDSSEGEYKEVATTARRAARTRKPRTEKPAAEKPAADDKVPAEPTAPVADKPRAARKSKVEDFKDMLGKMSDADVVRKAGEAGVKISSDAVRRYRNKLGIPPFKKSGKAGEAAPEVPSELAEALFHDIRRFALTEARDRRIAILRALSH